MAEALSVHINRGESDDYMAGFNQGWEDYEVGSIYGPTEKAPKEDPWRAAWIRGYEEGWKHPAHAEDD